MADNGNDFIRITNREIWDKLTSVESRVGSIDGRLNNILTENVDFRSRIRALEIKVYGVLAGTAALVATAVATIARGKVG